MHRLLQRQLKRIYGAFPDSEELTENENRLIDAVDKTYGEYDKEIKFIEHTLEVNSQELNEKNEDLSQLLSSLNEAQNLAQTGSWRLILSSGQMEWSDELYRILELSPQVTPSFELGMSRVHPDDIQRIGEFSEHQNVGEIQNLVYRLQLPSGQVKHVRERRKIINFSDGKPHYIQGTIQDITEQLIASQQLELYANVFLRSGQAILITDSDKKIIAVNPAFTELTGYTAEEVKGKDPKVLSAGDTEKATYQELYRSLNETGYWQGELNDRRKDGHVYPKWLSISASHDENGNLANYICTFSDISDRKADEERIHFLAHYDTLTGLLNRYSLEDRLAQAVNHAKRHKNQLAVLFIDMDRFKVINDSFGHEAGDSLLRQIAERLKNAVRENDIVCRLGGDEFVIVITELDSSSPVIPIAYWLQHTLSQPYIVTDQPVHSTPSIGISFFPHDGDNCLQLMKNADAAMYHAKEQGRNNFQFFSDEINKIASKRLELEQDLRKAIETEQFKLLYQPKFLAHNNEIAGVEALIRWEHPEKGLISPADFIPVAEETGLILQVGNWVIDECCRQLRIWQDRGHHKITIAINISTKQLQLNDLVDTLESFINRHNIQANGLEIEVTETSAMQNPDIAIENLNNISKLGIGISIDDFGTGHSSLAYIKSLPVDTLKLDRTFVKDIETDENDAAICKATISLSHDLGLKIVAEGVETIGQRDFLKDNNCDIFQGYLFSKPISDEDIETLLNTI